MDPTTRRTGRKTSVETVRAAEYVRMSTEHQKYSTENQSEAIRQYAARRGIEIVRTYADVGKSGLSLEGRDALKQLIDLVQSGLTSPLFLFMTLAGGDGSRTRMKVLTMSTFANALASACNIAPSSLRMMAARSPQLSKASSARWPANTAGSSQ